MRNFSQLLYHIGGKISLDLWKNGYLFFSCKILINSCLMSFCVLASANIFITFPLSFMFNNSSP